MSYLKDTYPFEWLDFLITITLSPSRCENSEFTHGEYKRIIMQIENEKQSLQTLMSHSVFSLHNEAEIQVLIRQYQSSLIILLDQLLKNRKNIPKIPHIQKVYKVLLVCLEEMLSFIETRFSSYLSLNERVSARYFTMVKDELQVKLDKLEKLIDKNAISEMILHRLTHFVSASAHQYDITYRVVLYKKELVKGLEEINWEYNSPENFSPLEQLLIYINFNSKKFMNMLTRRIASEINSHGQSIEKMDKLFYLFKAYKQLHRKPGIKLNPKYHDLDIVISNWFAQEIFYLEKRIHHVVIPFKNSTETKEPKEPNNEPSHKILCVLSIDQMALILRASDELRIIHAKSLSEVFRTITPHLSTPFKEDLSYDSMRSKSYTAEDRDKKIAIETLERIIKKIKEY